MIKALAAMKAGGKLEPFEYDPGALGAFEVEIDVDYCGICHSDLSMIDNEWGASAYPLVAGHEVVGRISQVGTHVPDLKTGDLVGLGWQAGYCQHCACCMGGDHNLCAQAQGTIIHHHGGFAEQVRAQAASVVKIPKGLDPAKAGPLFCGGITVFNPLVQFDIKPTSKVGVIGIGGLGHMALQFLNAWGCEVTAFTTNPDKAKEVLELGAHHAVNIREDGALKSVAGQMDLIISTVNVKLDWNAYLSALAPKGRLHFVGATLEPLDLQAFNLIGGQRSVSGSPVGSPRTIADMLEFAVQHDIEPVVEQFSFDQINEAIEHLRAGKPRYRVVLSRSQ